MRVIGATESLNGSTTKFKTVGAVWVYHTSAVAVTVRNAADDADIGVIKIPAGGRIITLGTGEGLRAGSGEGTPVVASGY
jgi:hypothetical protein